MIKAARVRDAAQVQALRAYRTDFHMLDAHSERAPGGTGESFDWKLARLHPGNPPLILSGGLTPDSVGEAIAAVNPLAVDTRKRHGGRARTQGSGQADRLLPGGRGSRPRARMTRTPLERRFGPYGGRYVPETLIPALDELEREWSAARVDPAFAAQLDTLLRDYVGRPTPLYHAQRLSDVAGGAVWLKREDLTHTGSHKINNALGQALLAQRMGKPRVIAETGAGQHGVAAATACALLGLECVVYMGTEDMRRQEPNVQRMRLLGAEVQGVDAGARTLKEAVSAAIRDWVANVDSTHYVIGSCVGPAPYPALVRDLQRRIGDEARAQLLDQAGRLPDRAIACVGGGSNAIGTFIPFVNDAEVELVGVEAAGEGLSHAATLRAAHHRRAWRAPRGPHRGDPGRGGPDPRGPLDLGGSRLPGRGARARLAAGLGARPLRGR